MLTYPSFFNGVAAPYQIEQSLRFAGETNQYLYRTGAITAQGGVSLWVKFHRDFGSLTSAVADVLIYLGGGGPWLYRSGYSYLYYRSINTGGDSTWSGQRHRDHSAWYHIFLKFNSSNSTSLYVNNVLWGTQSSNIGTSSGDQRIGYDGTYYAQFNLAEYHAAFGESLDATDFGEYDNNGVWVPKKFTGNYGSQGFYLKFDPSAANGLGHDHSGNGNHFTDAGGFTTSGTGTDVMDDTPTTNYCTFNPIGTTYSFRAPTDGNLETNSAVDVATTEGTFAIPKDGNLYYFEGELIYAVGNGGIGMWFGTKLQGSTSTPYSSTDSKALGIYGADGSAYDGVLIFYNYNAKQGSNLYGHINAGTVLGYAIKYDSGTWKCYIRQGSNGWHYYNGSSWVYNTTFDETEPTMSNSGVPEDAILVPFANNIRANFGQRDFAYTPPTGAKLLRSSDLPAPDIKDGSDYFQALIGPGEGTGSTTPIAIQYKTTASADSPAATYQDPVYGKPATDLGGADGLHPMFEWASRLSLGGHDDWYIPANNELEILYRNLKPTTALNSTSSGANANAVPSATSNYTSGSPAQTTVAIFQSGGSQAFSTGNYWSASEVSSVTTSAWRQGFSNGNQNYNGKNYGSNFARAIRRVPYTGSEPAIGASYEGGYFGGLIDAKATPNGTATHALIVAPKEGGEYGVATGILDVAQRTFPNGLWWVKDRANANQHQLVDSVRGGNEAIPVPTATNIAYAAPTGNSLAYCWNLVTGRTNGFDIVQYTGNGTSQTVSHSLGDVPEIIWTKNPTESYIVGYHTSGGAGTLWYPGLVNGPFNDTNVWNNTAPTSTEFSVGAHIYSNKNGEVHTAYLWKSVPGFSKIGSFTANGSAAGSFIYTGFRVAWVMLWYSDTGNSARLIFDSTINSYNPANKRTRFDTTDPESTAYGVVDLLSNGFKLRDTYWGSNPVAYMCFAENPFGGSRVSPATAR